MKETGPVARISKFLRKDNNLSLMIAGVAAVAIIAFILTSLNSSDGSQPQTQTQNDASNQTTSAGATADLETQLEQILSQVDGAGQVKVMVTYESGPEIVPAVKTDTQNNTTDNSGQSTTSTTQDSEPITVQGKDGTEPMVIEQKEPVVLGVLVVAEGASDLEVRLRLEEAVQVALQIAPDCIEVPPMNITQNREGN